MRAARFLWVPTLLIVLAPQLGAAGAIADAARAAPDSVVIIRLAQGDSLLAQYVSPWPSAMVRYRDPGGSTEYLSLHRIRDIVDARGNSRLREIVARGRAVGLELPEDRRSLGSWLAGPFRRSPVQNRRGYFLSEIGLSNRLDGGRSTGGEGALYSVGLGGLGNLSRSWALGGIAEMRVGGDDYVSASVGLRLRRYLGSYLSVETTQGVYTDSDRGRRDAHGVPYFGEIAGSGLELFTVFVRVERHSYSYAYERFYGGTIRGDYSDTAWHGGARFGPRPAFLSVPMAIVGFAVFLSVAYHSGQSY